MKKIFRKIHLWLSVPFGVFITLVCFSGAMLVYEQEITQSLRHDLYYVDEVKSAPLPIDSLMARVQATLPDSVQATSVTIRPEANRTWQVGLSQPRRASVFVDPYTGEVKGRNERLPFFDTMFHLHRWLLGPSQTASGGMSLGKWLVGTSVLMLVVILITGILMWLTNKGKPLHKSLTIKFNKGWHRFWHDLHVAGGIYSTIFLLAMALTGLTWSFGWYRTGFYGLFGVEASADGGHHGNRSSGSDGGRQGGRHGGRGEGRGHGRHRPDSLNTAEPQADLVADAHHHGHRLDRQAKTSAPKPEYQPAAARSRQVADTAGREASADVAEAGHRHGHDGTDDGGRRHHHGEGGRYHRHHADSLGHYAAHQRSDSLKADTATNTTSASQSGHRQHHDAGPKAEPVRRETQRQTVQQPADTSVVASGQPETPLFAHWQQVFEEVAKANAGYRQITISDGSAGVVPDGRRSLRAADTYDFDSQTGSLTGNRPYAEADWGTHVRSGVYMVHTGSWLGWITRLLNFLAALIGATLPLTGYYLWIKRLWRRRQNGGGKKTGDGRS